MKSALECLADLSCCRPARCCVKAVNEAAFTTAVEGSPHFAHLLDGLEHKSTSLLQHFEPLERIVLTANGNLQRVIR